MLPLFQIAKLIGQLALVAPMVTDGVDKMRKLVEVVRNGDGGVTKQVDALKQAVALQSAINDKIDEQLRTMESLLASMQKSLKILSLISVSAGIVAIVALSISILN
jgi:flagellar capping protein FliD